MKNELKMLTKVDESRKDCTYDDYSAKHICFTKSNTSCLNCIFEGRYETESNKRLQELIPIISLEDS